MPVVPIDRLPSVTRFQAMKRRKCWRLYVRAGCDGWNAYNELKKEVGSYWDQLIVSVYGGYAEVHGRIHFCKPVIF